MATNLDNEPDQKSENKSQEHYDKQFNELTSPDHMSKDGEESDLNEREANPDSDEGAPLEPWEQARLDQMETGLREGHTYEKDSGNKLKPKLKVKKKWKRLAIGGGLVGLIGGTIAGLFIFLPTLKVTNVLNNLEGRFYGFAANAIEARAEHLLSRYMRNYTFKSLSDCGVVVSRNCSTAFTQGGGIASTLFRTWHDAGIEERLFVDHGIEMRHEGGTDYSITTRTGTSILVDGETFDFEELRRRDNVSAREIRRELRRVMKNETHWYQLMYRKSIRDLASRKYNIRWCVFACETRDRAREARISALEKFKLKIIERTVAPYSDRLGVYLTCAVKNCGNQEFIEQRSRVISVAIEELGQAEVDNIRNQFRDDDGNFSKRLSQVLLEKITTKVFARTVAGAIPVVGWIYAVDAINEIDTGLHNGAVSRFLSDNAASQYAEFYLTYKTNYDEGIDGQLTAEEVGAQSQVLGGMELSEVYQRDFGSGANDSVGFNLFTPAYAQEENEYLCADEEPIPEGEMVCEERKVGKQSGYDAWRQSEAAIAISGTVLGGYRCGVFVLPSAVTGDFCSPGSAADIAWPIDDGLHLVFRALGDVLDAVGGFLLNVIPQDIQDWIADRFEVISEFLLGHVLPFLSPGAGPGRQVFDDLYAGADVVGNEFAKGFEDPLTGEFVGLGGRRLTDQEIEDNLVYLEQKEQEEFESKPFFARLFSPNESKSLLTTIAMSTPSSSPNLSGATQSLASILNPFNLLAQAGKVAVSPVYAQDTQYDGDPFGIHQYGYAVDDGMLTIDPEEVTTEACSPGGDLYEAWQDGIEEQAVDGQVVHETSNPCMLEYITTNILGCWFTESDDCGVDNNNVVAPSDSGITGSASPVDNLVSHPDLGPVLPNGYYRLPPAPNGEYEFWGNTPSVSQCGSRALVDLIYTVSVRWYQKYPDDRILVGDLNDPNHDTHNTGIAWDIFLESSSGGIFSTVQKAKDLGRMLADTGIVQTIYYNVTDVQNDFNTYVAQNNLPGNMRTVAGHYDHFHIRISEEFAGEFSTSCNSGGAVFLQAPLAAREEELNA